MRVLFVSDEVGWPENTGYRKRVANVARSLADLGSLDWVVLSTEPGDVRPAPVPDVPCQPVHARVHLRPRPFRLLIWLTTRHPWRIAAIDFRRTRAAMVDAVATASREYDVVFYSHLDSQMIAGVAFSPISRLAVVDLDNLESSLVTHELAALGASMRAFRRLAKRDEIARWRRLEQRAAATAVTFVCSELDVRRMHGQSRVLSNGTSPPGPGYRRRPHPEHPVVVFVGSMSYEPNIDAVEYFARHVLWRIRAERPDVEFRIVGRAGGERVRRLASVEGVTVVGEVASVEPELAAAHLCVAPIRFGGGTRAKILESFAHAVPVVTTTVGCEGLEVIDSVHALIADEPDAMASACLRLLRDKREGEALARSAAELAGARYDWRTITAELSDALRRAAATDLRS